jgi:16S rRNA (guanine(1405)-N(7))-methyltransferase
MDDFINRAAAEILSSRKYRALGIPDETVRDLLEQELPRHRTQRQALDSVRRKLHNIVAPYLGDPDYAGAARDLDQAFASDNENDVRKVCRQILDTHASTRERLPILNEFYTRLFACTGNPETILDLACGLNPFSFPWMGLPVSTRYYAYDLHHPRLDLINRYFRLQGLQPLAIHQDILVNPPEIKAEVALFFKEAHRFEQRQHGCNRVFWQALPVEHLLVSLPTASLSGRHSLLEGQRRLVHSTLEGLDWRVEEILFENEIVFWIRK